MTTQKLTIGVLAKQAGVTVEAIRFYQRRGLLVEPQKPLKGIRRYTEGEVQRLRFIKQAQKLGFSLDEIAELLSLEDKQQCREAKAIALKKLVSIRERIAALYTMETALSALLENCAYDPDGNMLTTQSLVRSFLPCRNRRSNCVQLFGQASFKHGNNSAASLKMDSYQTKTPHHREICSYCNDACKA